MPQIDIPGSDAVKRVPPPQGFPSPSTALTGLLQMHPDPLLPNVVQECSADFIILDAEHGQFANSDIRGMLDAIAVTKLLAMVRLATQDVDLLRQFVRMGADAVIVPHVSTVYEALQLAQALEDESRCALLVIIESTSGVANAAEILALRGIHGALVGPNDLTADLGCAGDYTGSSYVEALERIERAAACTGKLLGTVPHGSHSLEALLARGYRLLILGTSTTLTPTDICAQVNRVRSCP